MFGHAALCELLKITTLGREYLKKILLAYSFSSNIDPFSSSGSAIVSQIAQRTIAHEVSIYDVIGGGRFGQVYKGTWRGDDVAVKIFATTEAAAWTREAEAYSKYYLHHKNILGKNYY